MSLKRGVGNTITNTVPTGLDVKLLVRMNNFRSRNKKNSTEKSLFIFCLRFIYIFQVYTKITMFSVLFLHFPQVVPPYERIDPHVRDQGSSITSYGLPLTDLNPKTGVTLVD